MSDTSSHDAAPLLQRSPLYQQHVDAGARMVPFAGWEMPLHYGSQIAEHEAVRESAGVFDVSHMTVVDILDSNGGADAAGWLRRLLANDVARLKAPGEALYTAMLNERGGIIDDLIAYRLERHYRLVVNSATRLRDLDWMTTRAVDSGVEVRERPELAMLAVQGPEALAHLEGILGAVTVAAIGALRPFRSLWYEGGGSVAATGAAWQVARTGYTGEEGVEIILPDSDAPALWRALLADGVAPAGLGARDTLRLEAGLNLYGQDMDEDTTPLDSNMGWTVAWKPEDRDFIGRAALARQKADGVERRLTGLLLEDRGVPRHGHTVWHDGRQVGEVTSGVFAPTLAAGIALVRVEGAVDGAVQLEVRNRRLPARLVKPPFVRNGVKVFE